ncbi:mechanosensitive ion channel family protein [Jeongeupia chitinilytica]|uniref:Membrane protein n=1 Tax=Jeongeupia chitinilytica TaxID=1041641 RepID=A0ABQ3H0P4_9NEIS|nr:mechanosensitive ion channel family protein [Jeongeupia chitinilytica]GHD59159.1 membrane protein [Jeongeupia chitinilytica]
MLIADWLPSFIDRAFVRDATVSLVFITALLLVRMLIHRAILKRHDLSPELRRRSLVTLRNTVLILFVLAMALIWANEIETLAVSLVAIAAAIVLATKEMILCGMGSIYRTSSNAYTVGDRIEINGLRGLVIDTNLLCTTLHESSQVQTHKGTVGRSVTFPNSLLLSQPLFNETALGQYVIQTIHVSIDREADWQRAETLLLASANTIVADYADDLKHHARQLERSYAVETPTLEPRLRMSLEEREDITLHLQLPAPLGKRAAIEQRILRELLTGLYGTPEKTDVKS